MPRNSEQSLSRHSKNLPEDQILISGNVTNEMNYCYGCQIYLLKKDKHLLSFLIQTDGEHVITAMGNALELSYGVITAFFFEGETSRVLKVFESYENCTTCPNCGDLKAK